MSGLTHTAALSGSARAAVVAPEAPPRYDSIPDGVPETNALVQLRDAAAARQMLPWQYVRWLLWLDAQVAGLSPEWHGKQLNIHRGV